MNDKLKTFENRLNSCNVKKVETNRFEPHFNVGDFLFVENGKDLVLNKQAFLETIDGEEHLGVVVVKTKDIVTLLSHDSHEQYHSINLKNILRCGNVLATFYP